MLNIIHKTLVGGLLLLLSFFSQANDASPLRVGMWGSDNICIKEKKKFGWKNLA